MTLGFGVFLKVCVIFITELGNIPNISHETTSHTKVVIQPTNFFYKIFLF